MSRKKYLSKNEFRYNTNPNVRNPRGEGHMAYVSAKRGHESKINIITHAKTFYGEPTSEMKKNPDRANPSKTKSRFSVPRWEKDHYLVRPEKGYWRIDKRDKTAIKKFNKKYQKRK